MYVTRVSLDIAINPEQKVTGEDVSGTVGRRWHCGDVSYEDEGGIHPLCTCESSHKPTGGRERTAATARGEEGGPLVKRRLLENWGRLLGHSSFRQLSVGRRDRTGRILSLARAPSRSSIRVIAFPPLPFNVGKWAPCHACSPGLWISCKF